MAMSGHITRHVEPLLTIGDVATICQVSTKTVRPWIDSGVLRAAKLEMQWRIRPKDLELFVADRLQ